MSTAKSVNRIEFSLADLNSKVRTNFERLTAITEGMWFDIEGEPCRFEPFEGMRSKERQEYLLTVVKTTKAGPGQSAHNYGLAVDFAVRVYTRNDAGKLIMDGPRSWTWSQAAPWTKLKQAARLCGLDIPIKWDLGHVQPVDWKSLK